jgi:hypothetical protein
VASLEHLKGTKIACRAATDAFEENLPPNITPLKAARLAAHDPGVFALWCSTTAARAAVEPGFGHLLGLPEGQRTPVAKVLLHAATCHYYATAEAAAGRGDDDGCGGGSCAAWPYPEACCEPLFASLRPQHQWWLISDLLAALWAPERCVVDR